MKIDFYPPYGPDQDSLSFEVVERKGIGHPDTLSDAIAERTSRNYSKYCLDKFGGIAHHWFDKVMLLGGESQIEFGRGELIKPYTVLLAGKAALYVGGDKIPLEDIFRESVHAVLQESLREFNSSKDVITKIMLSNFKGPGQSPSRYRPSSKNELIKISEKNRVSNDCNLCVGYNPLSILEKIVLFSEDYFTNERRRSSILDTGTDVKVVGIRRKEKIDLTVNLPFIAKFIISRELYLQRVLECSEGLLSAINNNFDCEVSLTINPEKTSGRSYLTALGSVADTGDVGVVGRGNRSNGLITPCRPMSIEASAGKNPLDHTGKIYSELANRWSKYIWTEFGEKSVIYITTFKETPLDQPDTIDIYSSIDINSEEFITLNNKIDSDLKNITQSTHSFLYEPKPLW